MDTELLSVEVVGTRFRVTGGSGSGSVSVEEGRVRVSSSHLQPGVQEVAAGGSIAVNRNPIATRQEAPTPLPEAGALPRQGATPATPRAQAERVRPQRPERDTPRVRRHAAAETPAAGAATPMPRGGGAKTADSLLAIADEARKSGRPEQSVEPLERLLRDFPTSPKASIAAFTLGRVLLDELGRPRQAAAAFETARTIGLPDTLGESSYSRLVEAHARAGDAAAARRWAEEYRGRHPNGRYAGAIAKWIRP